MEKEFRYENGFVRVITPDVYNEERFHKATEEFLRKIIELEIKENQNGNKHKTGDIKKKSILDKQT